MNKKFRKITGIVTTGALVLSLGTGAMLLNNTTASAAAIDKSVQTEAGRFALGYKGVKRTGDESKTLRANHDGVRGEGNDMRAKGRADNKTLDLQALVEADLLTEEQVAQIEIFKDTTIATREAEKELVSEMTKEERMTYFEEKKDEVKVNFFDNLVEEGIIDTTEVEAIRSYSQATRIEERTSMISSKLEPLVTDGTLTSENVVDIIGYLNDLEPREKPIKGEEIVDELSPFDEMVSDSIITEAQGKAIEALMNTGRQGRK